MSRPIVSATILGLFFGSPVLAQVPAPPDLDHYVAEVMQTFKVPGLAIAIVKDGQVVLAKGYGVRRLGEPTPVDAHTLFGIGSNTKVFTATALALLVEEGKIGWDTPVINYVPWFRMSQPFVTSEMTVRDLLVHRSGLGLGAGDLLWWPPSTYDRKEIVRRLRYIPLATSFRSAYAYDNVLYAVAGEVIEAVSGQRWEDFVGSRILGKVGMTESTVRLAAGGASGNIAATHAEVDHVVRPVVPFTGEAVDPAGGIMSNAVDMAKWVMVQIDSGKVGEAGRLFSPWTTRQIQTIVTPIPQGGLPTELAPMRSNFNGYGLGEGISDYRGKKLVSHTGGLPGYVSLVSMVPDLRLGVVVLTNQESDAAFSAIGNRILDHYLGGLPYDWLKAFRTLTARGDSMLARADQSAEKGRNAASRPSLALEKYTGPYADKWYGDIAIALENAKLVLRFSHSPDLVGDLEHFQYDTFIARWRNRELRADAYVTFSLNPDGSIDQVKLRAVSGTTDFSFDFHDLLLRPVAGR